MIVIVDFGMGNLRSIKHKLSRIKINATITSDIELIKKAKKIILPGVGNFSKGIENLQQKNLVEPLTNLVIEKGIPVLGICLGLHLMTRKSEEGKKFGLGWIDAETKRFIYKKSNERFSIPHVGWNNLSIIKPSKLLEGFPDNYRFYFTHSYHVCCSDKEDVIAYTNYGYEFASVIQHKNIYGVQFHPEKSHRNGLKVIKNFIDI